MSQNTIFIRKVIAIKGGIYMKVCGFVNLDRFELNEDIEMKIYCCILKKN